MNTLILAVALTGLIGMSATAPPGTTISPKSAKAFYEICEEFELSHLSEIRNGDGELTKIECSLKPEKG